MQMTDLVRLYIDANRHIVLEVSSVVVLTLVLIVVAVVVGSGWWRHRRRYRLVEIEISLGRVGKVRMQPVLEDIQIAHKIWVELATRKAALPIDPEHDVIVEVYNSWYSLFGKVRELIAAIPAQVLRQEPSTRELVRIATATLNQGLRPHLTQWQAKFRNWYGNQTDELKARSPQEVQRQFPEYSVLMADMKRVNRELIEYAEQLQKIVRES